MNSKDKAKLMPDIAVLREAYERGENITKMLRDSHAQHGNTVENIELAYDLQSGSYTRYALDHPEAMRQTAEEMGKHLNPFLTAGDSILDCGTGELTTLSTLSHYFPTNIDLLAFDVSLSRVRIGKRFADRMMRGDLASNYLPFVADMHKIPLPDYSVDVVITSHALEPNHTREGELIRELLRVARRTVVLFEPSWENNTDEGRARMADLGYVRALPAHIASAGGRLVSSALLSVTDNPLNPTCCYVIEPPSIQSIRGINAAFACPITGACLSKRNGYWWSESGGWAYPEIDGIPCLRERHAILMTHR